MTSRSTEPTPSLEQQVQALKEQLARAQHMATLGELVSTATHEFNNVLMTVINYAKMGMRHKDTATRDKAFEKILAAGGRATKITNGILASARNRSGDFEPIDLKDLIDDVLVLLERELRKYRISVEVQIEDNVPAALVNPNQVQQVLTNLLVNARQAMERGGHVTIRLSHDVAGRTVDLMVRDTGPGIPQEKLARIFDPYYSTKQGPDETGTGGAGVGLSSCRDIIEQHKGKILVASTVGKGTAFTLKLPLAQTTEKAVNPIALGVQATTDVRRQVG